MGGDRWAEDLIGGTPGYPDLKHLLNSRWRGSELVEFVGCPAIYFLEPMNINLRLTRKTKDIPNYIGRSSVLSQAQI